MQRSSQKETRRGATHDGLREQCRKQGDYNRKPMNQPRNHGFLLVVARGGNGSKDEEGGQ